MNKNMQVKEFRLKLYPQDFYAVRAFYENELGHAIVNEWDRADSKGVMFDIGGTILEILTPEKSYIPIAGADISLEVDDVWALHETMASKPYMIRDLRDNPWGDTSFCIADPEGFEITFFTRNR